MIRVRATATGYYGLSIREEGDEFDVADEKALSAAWMERVDGQPIDKRATMPDPSAPRVAGPIAAPGVKVVAPNPRIKGAPKAAPAGAATGDQSVI